MSAKLSRGVRFSSNVLTSRAMEEATSQRNVRPLSRGVGLQKPLSRGVGFDRQRSQGEFAFLVGGVEKTAVGGGVEENAVGENCRKTQGSETSLKGSRFLSAKLSRGVCLV